MLTTPALWVAFAAMVPLMAFTAWNDIKHLRIPNWIPLTVLAIYVATGLWGLPMTPFLWGLAAGAIALVIGFFVYTAVDSFMPGSLGAGDVKLLAALVPFVDARDTLDVLLIYTGTIIGFSVLFLVVWGFRKNRTGLKSIDQSGKKVLKVASPFGVALAVTAVIYLWQQVGPTLAPLSA